MVSRVLLTGANGFIGAHILEQLLAKGVSVRAAVRSQEKANAVAQVHSSAGSLLDFVIVPDITTTGAFDDAFTSEQEFDTVIHTASPFLYRVIKDNSEFINPAVKGTTEVLKAVKRFAPSVKRVVITSSFAAVSDFTTPGKIWTGDDWSPITLEKALTGEPSDGYRGSKKFAEKAAWDFMENEKPNFDLVTLAPPMVYGPLRHKIGSISDLNQSNSRIYNLFIKSSKDSPLPDNGIYLYVDVRDIARAHILAATVPEASNKRFIIGAGRVDSQTISDVLRENIPELQDRTPIGNPGKSSLPENPYGLENTPAVKILGLEFTPVKDTFVDLAKQLLEVEKQ